jgi:hypothetical protein
MSTTDPDTLREEIAATREELGDTVEALAAKTDVQAHARRRLQGVKASMRANPVPYALAGGVVLIVVLRRRSR